MHIIAGCYKNQILASPKGDKTRPTSSRLREALFNICQNSIEGASVLDLFAGSGAVGLEALSRGASKIVLVEKSKEALQCIKKNIETLKVRQAKVICGDVFSSIKKLSREGADFDMVYADPPYGIKGTFEGQILAFSQYLLNVLDSLPLLKPNGYLFIEDAFSPDELVLVPSLKLISVRKVGNAHLYEFKKMV